MGLTLDGKREVIDDSSLKRDIFYGNFHGSELEMLFQEEFWDRQRQEEEEQK